MSRFCLDTSDYGRFKAGHAELAERIDTAEWVGVPSVVLGDLWTGFLGGRNRERNAAELARFLANPAVHEIPVQRDVARLYAEILVDLRRAGTPLPTNASRVAASAALSGATVLTALSTIEFIGSSAFLAHRDFDYRGLPRAGIASRFPDPARWYWPDSWKEAGGDGLCERGRGRGHRVAARRGLGGHRRNLRRLLAGKPQKWPIPEGREYRAGLGPAQRSAAGAARKPCRPPARHAAAGE